MAGTRSRNAAAGPQSRPAAETPKTDLEWGVRKSAACALLGQLRRERMHLSAARARRPLRAMACIWGRHRAFSVRNRTREADWRRARSNPHQRLEVRA